MIECEFIRKNLLVEKYTGKVNVDDIIILKEYEFAHEKYSDEINIIADLRSAEFSFDVNESFKLKEFLDANSRKLAKTKIAILTEEAKIESYSAIMHSLTELNTGIKIKLFADDAKANKWLSEKD